jgi:hypothetical protein
VWVRMVSIFIGVSTVSQSQVSAVSAARGLGDP